MCQAAQDRPFQSPSLSQFPPFLVLAAEGSYSDVSSLRTVQLLFGRGYFGGGFLSSSNMVREEKASGGRGAERTLIGLRCD